MTRLTKLLRPMRILLDENFPADFAALLVGHEASNVHGHERTKTGVGFAVPLTPPAVDQLRRLKRLAGRSPWVFPAETGDGAVDARLLTRSIARHLETFAEHKVGAFTLHDLRRTVRTGLARLGIRPDIAERCLNHAQPGIIETYDTHHYLEEKRDALTRWADHLQLLRNGS